MDTTQTTLDDDRQLIRPVWLVGALLMMLDGLTTFLALTWPGGTVHEGNPIAVWAIGHIGVTAMCVAKVVIGVAMVYRLAVIADRGHRHDWMNRLTLTPWKAKPVWKVRRNAMYALAFTALLMGVVVGNNLRALVVPS